MAKKLFSIGFLVFFGMTMAHTAVAQTLSGISPTSASPGQTLRVLGSGSGFTSGAGCTVAGGGTGVTINNCTAFSASGFSFDVAVDNTATPSTRTLTITGLGTNSVTATFTVAAGEPAPAVIPLTVRTGAEFLALLEGIINWIFVAVLIGAVIMIVLAGWQFIAGGGEPQVVAQARQKLIWAAVGIIIVVLSRGIVVAIRNLIGA